MGAPPFGRESCADAPERTQSTEPRALVTDRVGEQVGSRAAVHPLELAACDPLVGGVGEVASPGPKLRGRDAERGEAGHVGPAQLGPHRRGRSAVDQRAPAAGGRGRARRPAATSTTSTASSGLETRRQHRAHVRLGLVGAAVGGEAVVQRSARPGRAPRCRPRRPRPARPGAPRGTRTRRAPGAVPRRRRARRAARPGGGRRCGPSTGGRCGPGSPSSSDPHPHRALAAGLDGRRRSARRAGRRRRRAGRGGPRQSSRRPLCSAATSSRA